MRAVRNILLMGIRFVSAISRSIGGVLLIGVRPTACTWQLSMKFVRMELRGIHVEEPSLLMIIVGLQLPTVAKKHSTSTRQAEEFIPPPAMETEVITPFVPTNEKGAERLLSLLI